MSKLTFRVLVSLALSLVVIVAVFASVQAAQSKPLALGVSISNHTFKSQSLKQDAYQSHSYGDWDCGKGWTVDPDD